MEIDPFRSIKMKIDWGRTQLRYLGEAIDGLYTDGTYPIVFDEADVAGYRVMKVGRVEQGKIDGVACRLGVTAHAFRSALDHFAYMVAGGDNLPIEKMRQVDFPIWDRPRLVQREQWAKIVRTKVPCPFPRLHDALEALQPYEGGKDSYLWSLDYLDNTDKHRTLITLGAAFQGLSLSGPLGTPATWLPLLAFLTLDHNRSIVIRDISTLTPAYSQCRRAT